jgi:hypothetical protein
VEEKDGRAFASFDHMESRTVGSDISVLPRAGNPNHGFGIGKSH